MRRSLDQSIFSSCPQYLPTHNGLKKKNHPIQDEEKERIFQYTYTHVSLHYLTRIGQFSTNCRVLFGIYIIVIQWSPICGCHLREQLCIIAFNVPLSRSFGLIFPSPNGILELDRCTLIRPIF